MCRNVYIGTDDEYDVDTRKADLRTSVFFFLTNSHLLPECSKSLNVMGIFSKI